MYVMILAGGSGTRLFPLSREYFPKQFLKMFSGKSLFQMTYLRALKVAKPDEIIIVTGEKYESLVRNQVEEIDSYIPKNVVLEYEGRNTLFAVCIGMEKLEKECDNKNCNVLILPSDHWISAGVMDVIKEYEQYADDTMVLFGIRGDEPHIGYGYIEKGEPYAFEDCGTIPNMYQVYQFHEKPSLQNAEKYIEDGFLWNSGMLLVSYEFFYETLLLHQPDFYNFFLHKTVNLDDLPRISIDYGLLELSGDVAVVELEFNWNDLGDFKSLYDISKKDSGMNVGNAIFIDSMENMVISDTGKRVAVVGMDQVIVIDTPDALLVCDMYQTQRVKELVKYYESMNDPITQFHTTVHRPWGLYKILEEDSISKIKRIVISPGESISLQKHQHRSEHWVVVKGVARVIISDTELPYSFQYNYDSKYPVTKTLRAGESIFVPVDYTHKIKNIGVIPLEIIEVQIGEYLGEDDIERIQEDELFDKTFS